MITSKNNDKLIFLRKLLQDKKHRLTNNCYAIEGTRLLNDAIKYNKNITAIYATESAAKTLVDMPCDVQLVEDRLLDNISDTKNGQGVISVVGNDANHALLSDKVLVLDSLQDPGNVGTLMRSALAFGYSDIVLSNCVDAYSPKVIRSAMSAHFAVNIVCVDDIASAFNLLQEYAVAVADMAGQDVSIFDCPTKLALVLGNEGNGVSQYSLDNCSASVSLPMKGNLESLNVAIAGSLLMYLLQ